MSGAADKKASKLLSLVLRHDPGAIGLTLDVGGWAKVTELLAKTDVFEGPDHLARIVAESDKQRFSLSEDGLRVRANQGHSIAVDLGLVPVAPPAVLFHGTAAKSVENIMAEGLKPGARNHVHLSADEATALRVGQRHGKPVVLCVDAAGMGQSSIAFYRSENGVWLTDHVPVAFLSVSRAV